MAAARQAIITEAAHTPGIILTAGAVLLQEVRTAEAAHIRAAARDTAAEVLHQEEVTAEEAALHQEVIEDKVTSRKAS